MSPSKSEELTNMVLSMPATSLNYKQTNYSKILFGEVDDVALINSHTHNTIMNFPINLIIVCH